MSDELFRDTNRPSATWFIDCSKKKNANLEAFPIVYSLSFTKKKDTRQNSSDFRKTPVDLRPVEVLRSAAAKGKVAVGDIMQSVVNY